LLGFVGLPHVWDSVARLELNHRSSIAANDKVNPCFRIGLATELRK